MKIPTYEEVHTTNNYFIWFFIYSMFEVFVFVIKWFLITLFLYLLFSNAGVSANWYMVGENTKDQKAMVEISIPIKK